MKALIIAKLNDDLKAGKNQTNLNKEKVKNELSFFIKYTYLTFVFAMFCFAAIEKQHTYQIDLFPSIDSPFDNVYNHQINKSSF
jgi:hypothetical protein